MEVDKRIRFEAVRNLRHVPNIRDSLQWIRKNPEGFSTRVLELSTAIGVMNDMLEDQEVEESRFGNIARIKAFIGEEEVVNSPEDFFAIYDDWKVEGWYESSGSLLKDFFPRIHGLISSGKWEFSTTVVDPNKLTSALLIEGYGQLLEDYYEEPGLARAFVLGFEEVLINRYPQSELFKDVADWMVEEKDDFSPETAALIEQELQEPEGELDKAAWRINKTVRRGGEVYEVLDDMRRFPKPIAVDFNCVIADYAGAELNPEAPGFLQALQEVGTVFIVTSASTKHWATIHTFLREAGIWNSQMVLMTAESYEFISSWHEEDPHAIALRNEFRTMAEQIGMEYVERELVSSPSDKRVAPIFMKPFEVPIIDDYVGATLMDNPGMLGLYVRPFLGTDEEYKGRHGQDRISLAEAVEKVRDHYATIDQQ